MVLTRGARRAGRGVAFGHKWLSAPVECGCALVRDGRLLRDTWSLVPPYLRTEEGKAFGGLPWYSEYGFQQTRGFRALKLRRCRHRPRGGGERRPRERLLTPRHPAPTAPQRAPTSPRRAARRWEPAEDGAEEHAQHGTGESGIEGEQTSHRHWHGEGPLADGHVQQDAIDEVGGELAHPPGTGRRRTEKVEIPAEFDGATTYGICLAEG